MAVVDFSNAVLDVHPNANSNPMSQQDYLGIYYEATFYNNSNDPITTSTSQSIVLNTPSKVSLLFTGKFTANGTEFFINNRMGSKPWRVNNISFSNGDTYAFIIDIEVSGN